MNKLVVVALAILAAHCRLSNAADCRPYSTFNIECNTCLCSGDGRSYRCTEKACVDELSFLDDIDTPRKMIPYGNDGLPVEADPNNEPEIELMDGKSSAKDVYYVQNNDIDNENVETNNEGSDASDETNESEENLNNLERLVDSKDNKYAMEIDKNAYIVEDGDTGKAYLVESLDTKNTNNEEIKKKARYGVIEADNVIIDEDPETGDDVVFVPLDD